MGNEILSKYYQGILNQLQGEVDFINEVFYHHGLKGEGNEVAIRNLLEKFIPHKYGIGSGIVIDRNGTPSKQSDIVIYDNHNYPEILSLTSVHIYPVDLVYATIEVKTTLDSQKAKQAIENIKSVRSLDYIKDSFRLPPTDPVPEISLDTVLFQTAKTTPPIGIIFGYRSDTLNYDTFANWFEKGEEEDLTYWPSHVFCLDQGLIVSPGSDKRRCFVFPLVSGDKFYTADPEEPQKINGKEWVERSGRLFPLSNINKEKILIDQSKILLYFVTILSELLTKKHISPNISFRKHYLPSDFSTMFEVSEGEVKVFRTVGT